MARLRRYSGRQIRRTLAKYELVHEKVAIAPGIVLRIAAVDDAYTLLERMVEQEARGRRRAERFPYWAEVWPASIGLARWLATDPAAPRPGTALELGCGLGVTGIALAGMGWHVEATDFVEDALVFASHNARLNHTAGRHCAGYLDWNVPAGTPAPCIVAADILYEQQNHGPLERLLGCLLAPGGSFFVSDPGRPAARLFAARLRQQGYRHDEWHTEVAWRASRATVDVHRYQKPAS